MTTEAVLNYAQRSYRVTPDFGALLEIEDEIGSLAAFARRLSSACWSVGELVTVCHILLARAGCSCDYMALGREMAERGFAGYCKVVQDVMRRVVDAGEG